MSDWCNWCDWCNFSSTNKVVSKVFARYYTKIYLMHLDVTKNVMRTACQKINGRKKVASILYVLPQFSVSHFLESNVMTDNKNFEVVRVNEFQSSS